MNANLTFFTREQKDAMFRGMSERHGPHETERMIFEALLPHRRPEWVAYFEAREAGRDGDEKKRPRESMK